MKKGGEKLLSCGVGRDSRKEQNTKDWENVERQGGLRGWLDKREEKGSRKKRKTATTKKEIWAGLKRLWQLKEKGHCVGKERGSKKTRRHESFIGDQPRFERSTRKMGKARTGNEFVGGGWLTS